MIVRIKNNMKKSLVEGDSHRSRTETYNQAGKAQDWSKNSLDINIVKVSQGTIIFSTRAKTPK